MNDRKKKITHLTGFRLIIQIIFFIFLPALYIQTLNGVKQIYLAVITLNFSLTMLPQLIEVIAIIPITMILGRFFCGWMCAFGSFTDFIYQLSNKLFKSKWKINQEVDAALKYVKYIILVLIVIVVWSLNITIFESVSPWDAFGMLVTIGKLPDLSYVVSYLLVGFILFIGIMIASVFVERFFCRYLCPMGAIFAVTSKLRIGKIKKPREKCGNCRICTNNCAMGIPLYETDIVNNSECINCMKCVSVCPRNNANYTIANNDVRSLVVSAVSVAVITGSYYTTDFVVNAAGNNITTNSISADQPASSNQIYQDGTYQGTGTGFRNGTTKISVTVENDQITDIETVAYEDDKPFYENASASIFDEIINNQSTEVDTVSGATFSSLGIIEAVEDALSQAKISDTASTEVTTTPAETEDTDTSVAQDVQTEEADNVQTEETDNAQVEDKSEGEKPARRKPNGERKKVEDSKSNLDDNSDQEETDTSADDSEATNKTTNNTEATDSVDSKSETDVTETPTTISESVSSTQYLDGTYQGSGTGFRNGTTKVTVEVSGGQITTIDVVSYEDDRPFFERAYDTVTQEIIDNQSTDVDGVSGATFSSNGIMEAVADALSSAVNN